MSNMKMGKRKSPSIIQSHSTYIEQKLHQFSQSMDSWLLLQIPLRCTSRYLWKSSCGIKDVDDVFLNAQTKPRLHHDQSSPMSNTSFSIILLVIEFPASQFLLPLHTSCRSSYTSTSLHAAAGNVRSSPKPWCPTNLSVFGTRSLPTGRQRSHSCKAGSFELQWYLLRLLNVCKTIDSVFRSSSIQMPMPRQRNISSSTVSHSSYSGPSKGTYGLVFEPYFLAERSWNPLPPWHHLGCCPQARIMQKHPFHDRSANKESLKISHTSSDKYGVLAYQMNCSLR